MKRKLTLFLSAAVAMSSLPMTAYAANFKDINDVAWAASTINSVADKGLLSGYEDGTFRGKNNVTYPEAMQMLYNALVKSGRVRAIDAVTAYKYVPTLNTYKVPSWSQIAVAYGLENGIVSMQDMVSKFALGNKYATREDVADMFGRAMGVYYDIDNKSADAQEFVDFYSISGEKAPLVDLLKRMGVVSGDTSKRFNPKANINRAEMAVMLNKTFDILADGVQTTATITEISNDDGDFYYIEVELENGRTQEFAAKPESVKVYDANGREMSLSRLGKGDEIILEHNGDMLAAIRLEGEVSTQSKYDITGYISSFKDDIVKIENENTGESDKYEVNNGCVIFVEGKKVNKKGLEDALKENYKDYAYVGLMTTTEREKVEKGGEKVWEDVLVLAEMHVYFTEGYVISGELDDLDSDGVQFEAVGSSAKKDVKYADDCEFYIGDKKVDFDEALELAESGTTYVKVTVDKKGDAEKVVLSEDKFEDASTQNLKEKAVEVDNLSDKKITVEVGTEEVTYRFGSTNPVNNIDFMIWNNTEDEWDDANIDKAIKFFEDQEDADKPVYAKIYFNSGDKISQIELSGTRSAWRDGENYSEKEGTIASLEDDVLKLKSSTTSYNLLSKYNAKYTGDDDDDDMVGQDADGNKVKNPLVINGAKTSSLTVFKRMAESDDVELYAEIVADADDNIVKLEATVKSAEGKIVEYDMDKKEIEIELRDGSKITLVTTSSPDLTDEDEDTFTLEDIEGPKYVGTKVELGCNSDGRVDEITVDGGRKDSNSQVKVKGIAVAANDGLQFEDSDKVYKWLGRTDEITVRNFSGPSSSLKVMKEMIEDPDVEVYVEANLNDSDRVISIRVYAREAEGTLVEYDDSIVIKTDAGKKFAFATDSSAKISINDYDEEDLEDGKADGMKIKLKFDDKGDVSEIK